MAESVQVTEAKLKKLGARIRAGYAKLHPAKQEHLEAVRNAVAEQQRQKETQQAQLHLKTKEAETKEAQTESEKPRHRHRH